jgi:hypothetical protein
MPVIPLNSLTSQSLDAKFANKQRRYKSSFSASYLHHPSPPPRLEAPPPAPNPTFEALRAAAARLNLPEQDEQHGLAAATAIPPTKRRPVRKALLGVTATLALCALAAGSYYAWTVKAPDGGLASGGTILATLAQRFHDLTANQAVFRVIGEKIALLQPAQLVPERAAPATAVPPRAAEAPAPTPEMAGQAKPVAAQAEPATFPPAAATSPDAAGMAAASVPPVVTAQQLADTFVLTRQMGLLVRDVQAENERLRTQVAGLTGVLQTKAAEFEQRLAATAHDMRDAHDENAQLHAQVATLADALQTSSRAFEQRLDLALPRNPAPAAPSPGKQQAEAPALPASTPAGDSNPVGPEATVAAPARAARDYRVQAATFGIAVLVDANAAPGQAGRHLVAIGDQVPGVGRVTSITPRGTSWVVQTDHGAIQ